LEKNRLDMLLVEQGLAPSREKARGMILAGQVRVNGRVLDKPGTSVAVDSIIELAGKTCPYVSRGGLKIEKAGEIFGVDFKGRVVLDVGASTGGYTDYALQKGAARVYAVDVGYGQLDWKLRNDPRVVNLERTNIRYLERLDEPVDIVSIDVSFISTSKVFPAIRPMLKDNGLVISLIKPQFEAGRNQVGKKGVVRDPRVHREVLANCIESAKNAGLYCRDLCFSPITGPQGNIEYFLLLSPLPEEERDVSSQVCDVVQEAHLQLGRKKDAGSST